MNGNSRKCMPVFRQSIPNLSLSPGKTGIYAGSYCPSGLMNLPTTGSATCPCRLLPNPISYLNAVQKYDTTLTAFRHMDLLRSNYLAVTDLHANLVGVITRESIASLTRGHQAAAWDCFRKLPVSSCHERIATEQSIERLTWLSSSDDKGRCMSMNLYSW